jgi:methionine-R-sulfoxide reductase
MNRKANSLRRSRTRAAVRPELICANSLFRHIGFNIFDNILQMKNLIPTALFLFAFSLASCQNSKSTEPKTKSSPMENTVNKSDEEWKKTLTPEQYEVLRKKGTERPFTGEYNDHYEKGVYTCGGCGTELFSSEQKFNSHCGWPSFDNELGGGDKVKKVKDFSHGMIRTEIVCAKCGGHLGHLFDDGPTASGQRYCVNSLSLKFKPGKDAGKK